MIPHAKIRSALRSLWWKYSLDRKAALKAAKWNGTRFWRCSECYLPTDKPQVDHKHPVGKTPGAKGGERATWDQLVTNLFCGADGLRVLCAPCHQNFTNAQRANKEQAS